MVGKNNNYVRESKSNEHFQRFALRKLSVGVVSVAVAAGFYLGSGTTAQAATTEPDASAKTEQVVQQDANSTASDSASASNSSAAVSTSSATPVSTESASSVAVSDSPASASAASDNQASAANASESSSQPASSSVASDAAAAVSKDSQAASEANSQSAADTQTAQLPTSAANANESQAANILSAQAVQQAANQQAPAGFTVTDPTYPAGMYQDTDASHYTYWWAQSSDGKYNLVLSTDRNGDGKVYVFLLGRNNNVLGQYTVDKNKSTEIILKKNRFEKYSFGTVYNDGQSGVFDSSKHSTWDDGFVIPYNDTWKSKFNVFDPKAGEDNGDYGSISFMIPQVETQTTTYVDSKGKTVSDSIVQKGLDGQSYTTQGGKVINGYFAKEPSNANGYMSPFGKQGATYVKDMHDGYKATFKEINTATGEMQVTVTDSDGDVVEQFNLKYGDTHYVEEANWNIHSIYIPQTINIQYVYEKLGNLIIDSDSKAFPAEDKTTTQYPNDENDSTKAGNVTIPKVPGFTPTINGKTVTNYTFNPADYVSDLSQNITVKYQADDQEAIINFYDETGHKLLDNQTIHLTGKTGEKVDRTQADKTLAELEKQGYVLDKENTKLGFPTDVAYDNDDAVPQEFTIYLEHGTTHTSATDEKADQKTVTETIHYVYKDGIKAGSTAAADHTDSVTFKRGYTTDNVTGKVVSYDPWTVDGKQADSKTFDAVKSPAIAGYTADVAQVDAATVTPDSENIVKTVNYTADTQEAAINFYDETGNKMLADQTIHLTGKTGEKVDRTQADKTLAELEKQGYVLDKENTKLGFPTDVAYDNDDAVPQEFTIYLKHGTQDVSDTDSQAKTTATRTINVTTPDGKTNSVKQEVNYKRTATKDLVNGHITHGQWQADGASAWEEYTPTPQKGYTTLIDGAAGTKVVQKTPAFKDDKPVNETVNVTYQADAQEAAINFYDETDHKLLDKQTIHLTGKTGEKVDRTQADKTLAELEKQGYVLDEKNTEQGFPADAAYDDDDAKPQEFTIYLEHGTTHTSATDEKADQKTVTETIHYVYKDGIKAGSTAAEDHTDSVTFKRGYTTDKVTGKIVSYDPWTVDGKQADSKTFDAVKSPAIAGYTADVAQVDAATVTPDSENIVKTVNYTADAQEAAINFYDKTGHKLLDNQTIHLTGKTGEKVDRTQADKTLAELEKQGYVLDEDNTKLGFPADVAYDNDDAKPQEFTIYLEHGMTHTDATDKNAEQKIVTETIHYVYENNQTAKPDYTSAVDFKRGYTTDNVTGKVVSYDPWTVSSKKFGVVKSPAIEGYTPNHSQIDEITVTPDSKDVVKTVVYVGNAQEAQAIFYDETTGKEIANTREIATGKTDETISFAKDPNEVVKELEKQGYVFDKDNANNNVFVAGTAYDKNSEVHQYFKYYLKHGHAAVTPDQDSQKGQTTVTQTIKYEYADGTATGLADNVQTLTFKRTGDKDLVTHDVIWPDWSTVAGQQTSAVTSPDLKGYTADTSEIPAATYHAGDSDVIYVVKYSADAQRAVIKYIDGETGENLQKTDDIVDGHTNETINYSTADKIKEFVGKGYELVSDDFKPGAKFDNDDKTDQTYTVVFKHHRENVDPNHSSADGTKGTKTLTETVHYKYANGTTAAKDQTAQVTFTRNGVLDDVTGIVAWGKWNEASQSYKALTSPTIAGYTPSETVVKRSSNSDAEQGPTVTVIYTADAQKVHVQYIDGETDQLLRQDDLEGYTDETIPYSTAEGIKKFEGDGYELFKDNFPAGEKFDNDDANDQTYTVVFKHHRENVDPNHSSADGTKGTKTLTETVHYKYANGAKAAEDQTAQVTFTRNGVLDDVTGIVAWGKWNEASQSYKALTSPTIAGYTPSETVVKRSSNSDAEQGPTVTVVYTADAQKVHVQYIDGETDQLLRQDDLDGYTDETIPYSTAATIKKYEDQGYELFKDNFPAGEKFDNDDANDQNYTVVFKHHRENVDPNHSSADGTKGTKTLTETVHYKYANGTTAAEDQTAQVTFTRNGVLDDVTGIVAWGKWNEASQSYKALTSPTIAGYTPSEAVVKRSSNSDAEQGPTVTVVYTADAQTAYVKYVDDTTGKTLRQDDLHGYTDETIPYSTAEGIKKFEGDGYVLVSDGFKPGTKFGVGTPTYEVHFKHGTTHTSATDENADQKTVTETIHYVDENNQTVQPDYTAAVTFKRGYTTDNVTGKVVSYDPWTIDGKQADSKTFAAVTSPAVEGYTPNHQQINEFTVTPDSKDIVKTVVYVGDPQEAQAIFYDETTGKEISNTREIVNGKTDETISFTKDPNEVVKELEKQGYVFDKDNANNNVFVAGTTYDKNSEVHQYFKYYFTHATTIVTPDNPKTPADVLPDNPGKNYPSGVAKDDLNKTVTRTINITTPDGKTQTITQKAEFTRSATVDEVTGEVTYGPWSKNVVLESVDVPNIPGYVPSASVPEITVTPNDQDTTINITYKKLDSGKAADQGGNASNGGQSTNGQAAQNGQSGQTQNNAGAQQLPQTGNADNEKGALGLAGAMFAAGLGLGFGSKKKRHEN
ncbi:mucin-binding protein [Limosilactobacillus allomucosae]|uniref:mucin-binding protein n=2 Tax=Limosilactobacillus TaxID=2742598 RepID=UPI003265E38B